MGIQWHISHNIRGRHEEHLSHILLTPSVMSHCHVSLLLMRIICDRGRIGSSPGRELQRIDLCVSLRSLVILIVAIVNETIVKAATSPRDSEALYQTDSAFRMSCQASLSCYTGPYVARQNSLGRKRECYRSRDEKILTEQSNRQITSSE